MGLLTRILEACVLAFMVGVPAVSVAKKKMSCLQNDRLVVEAALLNESKSVRSGRYIVMYEEMISPRITNDGDFLDGFSGPAAESIVHRNGPGKNFPESVSVDKVKYFRKQEVKAFFPRPMNEPHEVWAEFYKVFPGAVGLINISLPGYDKEKCQALLYMERQSGALAAEGVVVRLRWRNGRWEVFKRESQWKS